MMKTSNIDFSKEEQWLLEEWRIAWNHAHRFNIGFTPIPRNTQLHDLYNMFKKAAGRDR